MACFPMAASHYPNLCWLISKGVSRHLLECIFQEIPMNSIRNMCSEITLLKLQPHFSGSDELVPYGTYYTTHHYPDSKVHGANMGPIWGWQGPGGPHVGPMNFAIWVSYDRHQMWSLMPFWFHCCLWVGFCSVIVSLYTQIARFMGPTWDPPGADRTQVGPMLASWTLLSGQLCWQFTFHQQKSVFINLWCISQWYQFSVTHIGYFHMDGLVQERRNCSALAMEYIFFALAHRCMINRFPSQRTSNEESDSILCHHDRKYNHLYCYKPWNRRFS